MTQSRSRTLRLEIKKAMYDLREAPSLRNKALNERLTGFSLKKRAELENPGMDGLFMRDNKDKTRARPRRRVQRRSTQWQRCRKTNEAKDGAAGGR